MNTTLLIICCSLGTLIPKWFPQLYLRNKRLPQELVEFLNIIPYASLTILIYRGIVEVEREMLIPTIVAAFVSFIIIYRTNKIGWTVFGGILAAFLVLQFVL